jgi:uncharacterized LabA/DUF88 family protein
MVFVDAQNLYHSCRHHFGHPWVHPQALAEALVAEDRVKQGDTHVLHGVRYYTGIHDANRNSRGHALMKRRLCAYEAAGVHTLQIPLRYDSSGRAREKGVDVRMALDLFRLGSKGLYDVAIIVSEDSDLDPAAQDVYSLRDAERWIAVENALPWGGPNSHTRWLASVRRRRRIDRELFDRIRDTNRY